MTEGRLFRALLVFSLIAGAGPTPFAGGILAAQATAYMIVGALSYGVWQNWWISAAWIMAGLTWMSVRPAPENPVKSRG